MCPEFEFSSFRSVRATVSELSPKTLSQSHNVTRAPMLHTCSLKTACNVIQYYIKNEQNNIGKDILELKVENFGNYI